jgi:hypothetical protein
MDGCSAGHVGEQFMTVASKLIEGQVEALAKLRDEDKEIGIMSLLFDEAEATVVMNDDDVAEEHPTLAMHAVLTWVSTLIAAPRQEELVCPPAAMVNAKAHTLWTALVRKLPVNLKSFLTSFDKSALVFGTDAHRTNVKTFGVQTCDMCTLIDHTIDAICGCLLN